MSSLDTSALKAYAPAARFGVTASGCELAEAQGGCPDDPR